MRRRVPSPFGALSLVIPLLAPVAGCEATTTTPQTTTPQATTAATPNSVVGRVATAAAMPTGLVPPLAYSLDDDVTEDLPALARLGIDAQRLVGLVGQADGPYAQQGPLNADQRREALETFAGVLDVVYALDSITQRHLRAWQKETLTARPEAIPHFDVGYLAYLEKANLALRFIDSTINKPAFEKLLDEGNVALGLQAGAYGRLKWQVVHVEKVSKLLAAHTILTTIAAQNDALVEQHPAFASVRQRIDLRFDDVQKRLRSRSVKLFGGNSVDIGVDTAHAVWFPVQAKTAEWMGDTRVLRKDTMLITAAQVAEAVRRSEPGDIIVERRNWYLSNIGLPGFWPHAALWLGSPQELTAWADDDDVRRALQGKNLVAVLQERFPDAWKTYSAPMAHEGHTFERRIIEAVSEGVVFSPAEESIRADYVAAMRPTLSKGEKARAIVRAFSYAFRPYDFDFDFETDSSLVCSELVKKAYEPREGVNGIPLPLERMMGRYALGPNTIVRTFDEHCDDDDAPLRFAWFLDGRERDRNADFADVDTFRKSWQRPKWDVVQR